MAHLLRLITATLMSAARTYSSAKVEQLREKLAAQPYRAKEEIRLAEAIAILRPALVMKLREGWTFDMLAEWLGAEGVHTSPKTLSDYLRKAKRRKRRTSARVEPENTDPKPPITNA